MASMLRDKGVVLNPEELSLLGDVFDRAMASLPSAMQTRTNRTEIAKNILASAATGERDPIELELAATMNLTVVAHTAQERRVTAFWMRWDRQRQGALCM
jgi:hypothetical protein